MTTKHEFFMNQALDLAKKATALGEVPVGAVVVKGGKVIGRGYNLRETNQIATAHAEIIALEEACKELGSWRLTGCSLYVTMEPCPMCAGAMVMSRINTLVFGCNDSLWGGAGSLFNIPTHPFGFHKIEVIGGICELEAKDLVQEFFKAKRIKKNNK